jgi:hypothetical protein
MKIVMAKTAADLLRRPAADTESSLTQSIFPARFTPAVATLAARAAVSVLARRTRSNGGLILLDRDGNAGFAYNTPRMAYGYVQPDGTFAVSV